MNDMSKPAGVPGDAVTRPKTLSAGSPPTGLHGGVRIGTPDGARAVEDLKVGDRVVAGTDSAPLTEVERVAIPRSIWAYRAEQWPIRVPVGALGNTSPIRLAPGQHIALRGPHVREHCGEPEVLVAVRDLIGLGGIARDRPLAEIRYYKLHLADHLLIEVDGALCDGLADGPRRVRPTAPRETARAAFAAICGQTDRAAPPAKAPAGGKVTFTGSLGQAIGKGGKTGPDPKDA